MLPALRSSSSHSPRLQNQGHRAGRGRSAKALVAYVELVHARLSAAGTGYLYLLVGQVVFAPQASGRALRIQRHIQRQLARWRQAPDDEQTSPHTLFPIFLPSREQNTLLPLLNPCRHTSGRLRFSTSILPHVPPPCPTFPTASSASASVPPRTHWRSSAPESRPRSCSSHSWGKALLRAFKQAHVPVHAHGRTRRARRVG